MAPPRSEWSPELRRARAIGLAVIGLVFLGFCAWSLVQVNRFALTADFSWYQQAVYLFGHGHLSPHDTAGGIAIQGYGAAQGHPVPVWVNGGEFFVVPLGLIYRLFPHPETLKWMQDLALCGAQAIAFLWICDLVAARKRESSPGTGVWLIVLGLVLLVANPWFIWSASFDIHSETFAAPFVIGAARDLHRGRRTAWAWGIGAILCSAVGATYLVGVSVGAIITRRRSLRLGLGLALLGIIWVAMLDAFGLLSIANTYLYQSILSPGTSGSPNQQTSVSYVTLAKAVVERPWNVFTALWANHANLWGNVSAAGLLGLVWLPVLIPSLFVLFQGGFYQGASLPGFQNILVGGLIAVGTVALCAMLASRLGQRRRWVLRIVVLVLGLNTIVWGAVWFPKVGDQWLNVSPQAAAVLGHVETMIGPNDEVVASQGVSGPFSARQWAYSLVHLQTPIEVQAPRKVWFVIAPSVGIETVPSTDTLAMVEMLSHHHGVHLRVHSRGIWAFEWVPPQGLREFVLASPTVSRPPVWTFTGIAGRAVISKTPSESHATNNGKTGYVIDRDLWLEPKGRYRISTRISASALTNVEIWDDTTNTLLNRNVMTQTHGIIRLNLTVTLKRAAPQPAIGGSGLWSIRPLQAPPSDDLEVRVWTAGPAGSVKVYSSTMTPIG